MSGIINVLDFIMENTKGQKVEAIVLGEYFGRRENLPKVPIGRVMSWEEAIEYLDYSFWNEFGGEGCHPFVAWTASWVLTSYEYDGSVNIIRVPRNPAVFVPTV